MVEDNFDEEDSEDENNDSSFEDLENIIKETEQTPIRQIAHKEILPILKDREMQRLEQGVANIIINKEEENEEEPGVYELNKSAQGSRYESSTGVYNSSSSVYDQPSPTFDRTSGMGSKNNNFQNPFSQESQQGTIYQTKTKEDADLKKERERRNW